MATYKCTAVCWLCPQEIERGTPRKYCAHCADVAKKQQSRLNKSRACRGCGDSPKFHSPFCESCSEKNQKERRRKKMAARQRDPRRRKIKVSRGNCSHCGNWFERPRQGQERAGKPKYCSRKCVARMRSAKARSLQKEIGDLRWIASAVRRQLRLVQARKSKCRYCGNEFQRIRKYMLYCSEPCRDESKRTARRKAQIKRRNMPSYRKHKSAYKAKRRRWEVAVKPFDPIEVLERDGWRCYLCGVDTPRSLRGQMAPNAPEIDHVIPLALGGEHSMANTRCACRHCNGKKGASLVEIAA